MIWKNLLQKMFIITFSLTMINSLSLTAQKLDSYGDMERPANVGNADFDNFKNSSFDIYYNSHKLDQNLKTIEGNLVKYADDKKNINFESLRKDILALNKISESSKKLSKDLKALDDKSKSMVENATKFKPRTKAPKAIKNTDESVKALDDAKDTLKRVSENQVKLLKTAEELLGDN